MVAVKIAVFLMNLKSITLKNQYDAMVMPPFLGAKSISCIHLFILILKNYPGME